MLVLFIFLLLLFVVPLLSWQNRFHSFPDHSFYLNQEGQDREGHQNNLHCNTLYYTDQYYLKEQAKVEVKWQDLMLA